MPGERCPHNPRLQQTHQLAKKFAKFCKTRLYAKSAAFNHVFPPHAATKVAKEMNDYFNVTNAQGPRAQFNLHEIMHQMMRTSMHIHLPIQRKICLHYLERLHHGPDRTAHTQQPWACVQWCVSEELERNRKISNTWDVKLMQVLVEQYGQEYYSALDAWYTALREDIVLIQWCANWRNDLMFWMDDHGPLRAFIYPVKSGGRVPTYRLIDSGRTMKFTKYFGKQMD